MSRSLGGADEAEPRLTSHAVEGYSRCADMVVLTTLAYERIDDFLIVVHSTETPSDSDWDRLMQEPLGELKGTIVVAGGTKLDARKRKVLAERVKDARIKVAVLVSSSVARGVVTALGWLVGGYRAFAMDELDGAGAFVGVPPSQRSEVERVARELRTKLDGAKAGQCSIGQ